jgi:hypothetical protein
MVPPAVLFLAFLAFFAFFAFFFFLAFVVMLFRLVGVEVTAANIGAPSESAKPRVHSRVNSFFIVRFEPPLKLKCPWSIEHARDQTALDTAILTQSY